MLVVAEAGKSQHIVPTLRSEIPCTHFIALYLAVIIIACTSKVNPSESTQVILDKLSSAALFMTFGATLLTTVLIAYRISSVTRRDPRKGKIRTYTDIIEALIQSAAAYSLVALLNALTDVVPQTDTNAFVIFCAENYACALLFVTAVRIHLPSYIECCADLLSVLRQLRCRDFCWRSPNFLL